MDKTREPEELEEGPKAEIHTDLLKRALKKVSNWKTPGHDGIKGFWFKKFTAIHDRLALEMNKCLQTAHVPEWMTKERTTLIRKDPNKGTTPNNYRSITCLPVMWKIFTAQIREEIYHSLTSRGLFPDEEKRCCKGSRGTAELLYIDQHSKWEQNQTEKRAIGRIVYKKAYDMVPHSLIINSLKMYKISDEVINFIDKTMKIWRVELTTKNEEEVETLIPTVRTYSRDIGMEFGIEKCARLVMKSGKRQLNDGMELPKQHQIKTLTENETYKYLGILKADTIKQMEMKEKIQKEYLRRTRKLLEAKFHSRNLIKGINT